MKKILLLLLIVPTISFAQSKCKGVTIEKDEFRKIETRTHKKVGGATLTEIQLVAMSRNDSVEYGIKLSLCAPVENLEAEGVFIKFSSGKTVERLNNEVDMRYYGNGLYQYFGYIVLTREEFEIFTTEKAALFQLDRISKKVSDYDAIKLVNYANCIK